MSDYTLADVRAEVERYLAREIDASELESRLVPMVWDEDGPQDVLDLAHEVIGLRFEQSGGFSTEDQLREDLRKLVFPAVLP
ncbi:MAG: hypothetical protein OXE43_05820 [Chloroflexi bacterium]|nr:hypothetical protein [Chloroflexota bacterium]